MSPSLYQSRWILLGISLLFGLPHRASAQTDPQGDPVATITLTELRDHVYYLASDRLEGRYVGSEGYRLAARYADEQFRQAGLKALITDSDETPTFLQSVPFRRLLDRGSLVVRMPAGTFELNGDEDFKYLTYFPYRLPQQPVPLVFVGFGIEEPEAGWNDYTGLELAGKAAIMLPGAPRRRDTPVLPESLHTLYSGGDGDGLRFGALRQRNPTVLLLRTNSWRAANWDQLSNSAGRIRLFYHDPGGGEILGAGSGSSLSNQIVIREEALERIFQGQEYSPARIREEGIEDYRTFQLEDASIEFRFRLSEDVDPSWNVLGMVEGSDPALRNEYVVVGAHLDHIPPAQGQICNGADDNASGSAGVIEIAEAVALDPPRRSVVFVLYTGEEIGLVGSNHFLNHSPIPTDRIIANINLDMIGRTDPDHARDRAHYVVSINGAEDPLCRLIGDVNGRTINWPLVFTSQQNLPGGSDHLSYEARGIPAVFFFSGHHRDLHRPTDDPDKIEYDKMQKISQLVYEVVMEIADRDEPFEVCSFEMEAAFSRILRSGMWYEEYF